MKGQKATSHKQSVKSQYIAASVASITLINYGITCGWSSPSIDLLTSDKSPLPSGKITMEEASWIASALAIGALPGNVVFGFLIKKFGRKWPLTASSILTIISWLLILFARNVYYLYAARVLQGIVIGGTLLASPVYLIEIADDRIRGILGTTVPIGGSVGILLAFTLGNYCDYSITPIYSIVSTIVFSVLFSLFPETPIFLVRQNKISEAEKSLRYYRSIRETDDEYLQQEMTKLKSAVGGNESQKSDERDLKWSDFTTKPGSRAMLIAMVLVLLNQLSGTTAMLTYTATIFNAAGSALAPNTSAMIVGIIQLVGTFIVTPLIDRSGRRFLYMTSTIGTAIGLIALGLYMMLKSLDVPVEAYNWFPIVAFSFAIFTSAWAVQALPIACTAEVMPDKMKEIGVTFAITLLTAAGFFITKFLPLLAEFIGFHGCLFFFATICLLSAVFIWIFLPETKGRSYEEIMESLR